MFNSWMNSLTNWTRGLNLSDWDKLLVLRANIDKEPLNIVKKHMAIGKQTPLKFGMTSFLSSNQNMGALWNSLML